MRVDVLWVVLLTAALAGLACSSGETGPAATATPPGSSRPTVTVAPLSTATPAPPKETPVPPALEPYGLPLDPATRLGEVTGSPGMRRIDWGTGPDALTYSRDDQPSADPERANRSGWNCRTHLEYEAQAAVDWYVPGRTPVYSTMDGFATLSVVTVTNAFDYYGVDREPYLGNPDRARAAISPFPGPGGGKGAFVSVENERFVTEYGHLDLMETVGAVPRTAFVSGYGPQSDFAAAFAPLRDFRVSTAIAQWPVKRGDLLGYSGDSGYSEAPHLHYTIRKAGSQGLLCPTSESGFEGGGWLRAAGD